MNETARFSLILSYTKLIDGVALAAIEWVAQKARDIGNAVINEAFDLAKDLLSEVQKILSEGEADIPKVAQDLENDLEGIKVEAIAAINAAEKDLDEVSKGILKAAFDKAKSLFDEFVDGLEEVLSDL